MKHQHSYLPLSLAILIAPMLVNAGTLDPQQQDWFKKYQKQANAPKPEAMLLNTDVEPDLSKGFVQLFNGKDLTGWKTRGGTSSFTAKDGILTGTCTADSPSTYLCTDREDYSDFLFTCEMKWVEDINSGVMFRAQEKSSKTTAKTVLGPQAEMEGTKGDRGWSGGIYGQDCGGYFYPLWLKEHQAARAALKPDDWNRLTIQAKGKVVKTWLNGVPAANWVGDGTYAKGFFGLQIHKAKRGSVQWRNIRIKELDGTKE